MERKEMVRNVRNTPLQGQARSHDNLKDEWMCEPREKTLKNG